MGPKAKRKASPKPTRVSSRPKLAVVYSGLISDQTLRKSIALALEGNPAGIQYVVPLIDMVCAYAVPLPRIGRPQKLPWNSGVSYVVYNPRLPSMVMALSRSTQSIEWISTAHIEQSAPSAPDAELANILLPEWRIHWTASFAADPLNLGSIYWHGRDWIGHCQQGQNTLEQVRWFQTHKNPSDDDYITRVEVTSDGGTLFVLHALLGVMVIDTRTRQKISVHPFPFALPSSNNDSPNQMIWLVPDKQLVVASHVYWNHYISILDVSTGVYSRRKCDCPIASICRLSTDVASTACVVYSGREFRLMDPITGKSSVIKSSIHKRITSMCFDDSTHTLFYTAEEELYHLTVPVHLLPLAKCTCGCEKDCAVSNASNANSAAAASASTFSSGAASASSASAAAESLD